METKLILETSIFGKNWENEPYNKEDPSKNMPGNTFEMGWGILYCLAPNFGSTQKWASIEPFEMVCERPFQLSVLGIPHVDLECESKNNNMYNFQG